MDEGRLKVSQLAGVTGSVKSAAIGNYNEGVGTHRWLPAADGRGLAQEATRQAEEGLW